MSLEIPSPADRALARENAKQIAVALNSKMASNPTCVLGLPHSPFKVPYHTDHFWFTVLVSDCTYTFRGNHKRGSAVGTHFCVSIKHPWRNMATSKLLMPLSRDLGFDVFAREWDPDEAPSAYLLRPAVRKSLNRLDLLPVHLFFLNAAQILVESEFTNVAPCVEQIQVFRELLLTLAHEEVSIT